MSRRQHPIDDAFRKKLKDHASDTPMHLWEGIEQHRNAQQKIRQLKQQRALLAALLIIGLFAAGLSWYSHATYKPPLSSFPVWETEAPIASMETAEGDHEKWPNEKKPEAIQQNAKTDREIVVAPTASLQQNTESIADETAPLAAVADRKALQPKSGIATANLSLTALPRTIREVESLQAPEPMQASGCADFAGKPFKFYFDAIAAPGFAERRLSPRGQDFAAYANTREQTEVPRFMYSAALRLSVVTQGGLALRTGVNYSEINERFQHTIENEVRTIITNIYGQNGEIIGTDTTIESNSRRVFANNRYRTLDIPVLVGYETQFKNITLTLNGGAYVNVYFKPEGEFLSPESNRPVGFSNDTGAETTYPAFREGLGIGWYGSLGVQYKISPRLQLLVEPHVKMYPRSFTREDFMVDQNYLTAGVFVGLRHQFQL